MLTMTTALLLLLYMQKYLIYISMQIPKSLHVHLYVIMQVDAHMHLLIVNKLGNNMTGSVNHIKSCSQEHK